MAPITIPRARMPRRVVLTLAVLTLLSSVVAPLASAEPGPSSPTLEQEGADLQSPAESRSDGLTDQLVVRTAPRGLEVARTRLAQRLPGAEMRALDGFDGAAVVRLLEFVTLEVAEQLADELVRSGVVASAEADPAVRTFRVPNDPLWSQQWGPNQRRMPEAWSVTIGGTRSPVVAVIDTGVVEAPEIEGRVLEGLNALDGSTDTRDTNGHGTLSATLIAGRGDNGIGLAGQCWDCRILPVKALGDDGSGRMSDLAVGLRWAVDNGADIINISAGGSATISLLTDTVAYAEQQGVTIVASAGNDGQEAVAYPAAYSTVLSVAGSMADGDPYSWTNHGPDVDLAAPGCNVAQRLDDAYVWFCGTSSAAPFVTGLLALALDVEPSTVPAQLRTRARDTSDAVDYVASGIVYGPGIVSGGEGPVAAVTLHAPSLGDLQVGLQWSPSSGGSGSGYRYQLHRSAGSSCSASSPRLAITASLTAMDRSVEHGRTYRYCVYAIDGAGNRSARSNVRSVTVRDTSPPPRPDLRAASSSDGEVRLGWTAVSDPTAPVTYAVHRTTTGACSGSTPVVGSTTRTSFTDTTTIVGRSHRYCVTARDGAGNTSLASNAREVRTSGCYALTGDWNGVGRDGIGWWCDGRVLLRAANGQRFSFSYGRSGDVPVAGDWNGSGRDTLGIIRDGRWHLRNRLGGGPADLTFTFGRVTRGDNPIVGDWNGTGRDGIGIIRGGTWHLRTDLGGGPADATFTYGQLPRGDLPLVGDWNGRGSDRIGIVRNGRWHLRHSLAGGTSDQAFTYGRVLAGDLPVIGDWTGNGRPGPGIVRGDTWHLRDTITGGAADRTVGLPRP